MAQTTDSVIHITLPDGSLKEIAPQTTISDFVLKHIGEGLLRAAVAAQIDGVCVDLSTPLTRNCNLAILTFKDALGKQVFWHSSAHVLAIAVTRLFPHAKLTIGPPIEEGFYYDIYIEKPFTEEDIAKISEEMKKVIGEKIPFERVVISESEAKELFKDNKFKLELIEEYKDSELTIYKNGSFYDLCRGPHVSDTGRIKSFALTKFSGAYWRANADNEQLQRIYGISYPNKDDLKVYLERIEQAKLRDHRKLGKEHELIMFHEFAPGAPFFLERGTVIYNELIQFIRNEYRLRGYAEVITPQLFNKALWEQSGHWEFYKDDMFIIKVEGVEHSLKPMNCPSHCLIYNTKKRSYKELPIRIADFCNLHRNELSGALSGLTRVRKFAQDDAHIFCSMSQVESEVEGVLSFIKYVWEDVFKFKLNYSLSTRPEKKLGDDALWDKAENMLANALQKQDISFNIKKGDGAFYGPKIDIDLEDALGRKWQCPTCQLDFNLPKRFNCVFTNEAGSDEQCVMIHRAVLGSLERFYGIMIEHYAAKFPVWLSPVQVKLLPIADRHIAYCETVKQTLELQGIRVDIDDRTLTTPKKVRDAQLEFVPYICVVGDSEIEHNTLNIRTRDNVVHGEKDVALFGQEVLAEIVSKSQ
jgi:threonyl-tRNA synthetase